MAKKMNKQAVTKAHKIAKQVAKAAGRKTPTAKDYATGMKVEKQRLKKRKK